jgi:hypothetical protein
MGRFAQFARVSHVPTGGPLVHSVCGGFDSPGSTIYKGSDDRRALSFAWSPRHDVGTRSALPPTDLAER